MRLRHALALPSFDDYHSAQCATKDYQNLAFNSVLPVTTILTLQQFMAVIK
jgi:hypothetical protein